MYGVALGLAGSEPKNVYERVAVGLLRKLSSSPASIFVPGQGYLQTLDNLLTYSHDLTNAVWNQTYWTNAASDIADPFGGTSGRKLTATATPGALDRVDKVATSTTHTFAFVFKPGTYANPSFLIRNNTTATSLTGSGYTVNGSGSNAYGVWEFADFGSNGWKICRITCTSGITVGDTLGLYFGATGVVTNGLYFYAYAGFFTSGAYTASQIAALGIPWTMGTASVSLSLGPEIIQSVTSSAEWTVSNADATHIATFSAAGLRYQSDTITPALSVNKNFSLTVGRTYVVSGFCSSYTSGALKSSFNGGTVALCNAAGAFTSQPAVASLTFFDITRSTANVDMTISSLSVREILSVACPVYTDAHVYLPGSTVTTYGPELVTTQFTSLTGYINQTKCTLAIVGDEVELTATDTGVCFVDVPSVAIVVGSTYQVSVLARYSGSAGGVVYFGAVMFSVPYGSPTTSATSVPLSLTPVADHTQIWLRMRLDATAIGQKAYFKLGSVREVITTSSVTSGLLSNNYTLSNGSTGYSAVDGTAGLVLDAAGSVGSELVTNGTNLVTTTGWTANGGATLSVVSGALRVTNGTAAFGFAAQSFATVIGQTYYIPPFYVGANPANTANYHIGAVPGGATDVTAANAALPRFFVASQTTSYISVYAGSNIAANYTDYNNISVKQVTGIHATQATTANKPALRRGLYNLLTYSNDLSNAAWTKNGVGGSAQLLTPSASSGQHFVNVSIAQTGTPANTFAVIAKASGYNWLGLCVSGSGITMFDLESGSVGTTTTGGTPSILPLGDGYYLCAVTRTYAGAVSYTFVEPSDGQSTWTPDGVSGIEILGSGLFAGTLTASQILSEGGIPLTTSAAASNSGAGRYWWDFPTAGKGLVLGSPVAQMTDDSWCVVCINAVSNGSDKYIANLGCGAVNQLISSVCIKSTGVAQAAWVDDGGAHTRVIVDAVNHHGIPTVISAVKRGGVGYLRVNGVQIGSADLTVMGTTTVTAGMIGGFNAANTSNQFVGSMGQPQMGKGTISDADLLIIERLVAANAPNGPSF